MDEWQHETCKSSRDTVYTPSALKTAVHVVLEVCRQEGGLDPAAHFPSRAGLCLLASEMGAAPFPCLLTACLPDARAAWRGPLGPGGRALRPALLLLPSSSPSLSLPARPRSRLPAERRVFAGSTPASHAPLGAASRSLTCLSGFHP